LVNSAIGTKTEVFYWRERGKEVDFVLHHGRNIIAIEVKRQAGIFSTSIDIVTKMEYYPIQLNQIGDYSGMKIFNSILNIKAPSNIKLHFTLSLI